MVALSLHNITLVGCHSYFFYLASIFCQLLLGLAAAWQSSSDCGRQHWYIQCLFGHSIGFHSIQFHSILHTTSEILQTVFCFHLHLGSPLLHFFDHHFCLDRISHLGSISLGCSRLRNCFNHWPSAAAEDFVYGVLLSCNLLNWTNYSCVSANLVFLS